LLHVRLLGSTIGIIVVKGSVWQTQAPNLSAARAFAFVALHLHSSSSLLRNSDRARAAIADGGEV
jgi:hypothetical protein